MSRSIHATRSNIEGKTKKEIDEMANDPDSVLHELAEKRMLKKEARKKRKLKKENNEL